MKTALKRPRLFLIAPGWDASRGLSPSIKFAGGGTHLHLGEEDALWERSAKEHNKMHPARARDKTARSRDERTN